MYITHPDLILSPQESREVTYSGEVIVQNKNINSGLVIDGVVVEKSAYKVAMGTFTIKNLGWTHAFVSVSESTGPVDIPATAVYLDSVPFAILNSVNNPPPAFTTNPPNASGYTVAYEAEGASITVNPDGTYNVVDATSGSRIKVILTNSDTTQVNDSSGIFVSELSAYTASTTATNVGATYQLDYTIEPTEVATHPDLVLTFTTTDPLVATISNTGLATGTGDGFCRIGVEANFRGAIASDSSGFTVNAIP